MIRPPIPLFGGGREIWKVPRIYFRGIKLVDIILKKDE